MSDSVQTPKVLNLVDESTGEVVNVNESDIGALGGGYRLASEEEVAADLERQQYGEGFGNEAAAFGESALSGATLGLSDVAARTISPEYAEELAKRREYNPTAAGLGEATGILGATLLTGGAGGAGGGLLRGAARVATAPTRGLLALGEATTAGTARLLGTEAAATVLGRAGREALAYGVGGAVEGALFGAAKEVTDAYLTDEEITTERIILGAGTGALWGGGLGAGLGAAGSLLGSAGKRVRDIWSRSDAEKEATAVLDDALRADVSAGADAGAEAAVAEQVLTADQKILQQVGYRSDDQVMAELTIPTNPERVTALEKVRGLAEQADAAKRFDGLKKATTDETVSKIEEFRRIQDEFDSYIHRGQKKNAALQQAKVAPPEWTPSHVDRVLGSIDETRTRFQKMRADSTALDSTQHAAMKEVVDLADELEGRLKGFSGRKPNEQVGPLSPDAPILGPDNAETVAEIFDLHDRFKSALGRAQRKAGRATPSHVNAAEAAIQREYMAHRGLLEAEELYGKGITEMQRVTNAAESEAISYARAWDDLFGLPEGQQTLRSGQYGFDKLSEASHPKIRNLLETVGDDPQRERTFVLGLQRQADLLKVKGDYYSMPPAIRAKADRAKQIAEEVIGGVREVKATRQMADEYAGAIADLKEVPIYGEQLAKLQIAFGRTANIVSGVSAEGRAVASGGKATARSTASTAIKVGLKGEKAAQSSVAGVVKWLRSAGKATEQAARRTARATYEVSRSGPLLGVSFSAGNPSSYERLVRNVAALRDPESDERKAMRTMAYGMRQQNPRLANALESHTQRVADFLASKAGPLSSGPKVADPFGDKRKPRHDPAKAERLARYVDAATNPAGALERIAGGEIMREDVEVLQTLYPRMYQRVRDEILMNLSKVDELPSYEARLKLGNLLNAPADPSMRPEMVQALQQLARSGVGAQEAERENSTGAGGEQVLSPSRRREPRIGKFFATQVDAQSVEGPRFGG